MENDAPRQIVPAAVPAFGRLFASLPLLLVLCKVAAVTVVGLIGAVIGAVIVRRCYGALLCGEITTRQTLAIPSKR